MKKLFLILSVAFIVQAVESVAGNQRIARTHILQQEEKEKIAKEELPEAARKTLDSDAFKGWTVVSVYRITKGDYEVELKKDETIQTVKFDKEGKIKN